MGSISIVIPFHLNENQKYLDLCLESLAIQDDVDKEVLVIAGTKDKPKVPHWVKLHWTTEQSNFANKMNAGMAMTNPMSTYVMTAQDDLVFSRNSIRNLMDTLGDYAIILNPMSNCDNMWRFIAEFKVINEEGRQFVMPRFLKIEDIIGFEKALMEYDVKGPKVMFDVNHNALYCSIMKRESWHLAGPFDEGYRNGCEDTDLCFKAKTKGIRCAVTPSAYVTHFGGATTSKVKLPSEENRQRFISKWGVDPHLV